uniref:C3H n=1 Tax=Pogostemon cablin TaxID=28511 RepID=A0A9E8Z0Z1_POGCB|nr:C3H [Pogostemon cablin]
MGGSQKSKRVTWASDVNLCQVRLFLSEDSPSQVGLGTQDHLQAKALWPTHAGGAGPDDNLPPGFEGIQPANPWTVKLSQIPIVKWKCPPRFELNSVWRVVAGEESKEVETQNQRESRVLEAIYPRPSAIPLNPSALVGVEETINSGQHVPVVPITSTEDEDASVDPSPMISQPPHSSHGTFSSQGNTAVKPTANGFPVEQEIVAAAHAALSSLMPNDQGNLIDRELLIKILSNPKMVEQLTSHAASSSAQSLPSSSNFHGPQHTPSSVGMKNFASSSSPGMSSTSTQYMTNMRSPPKNSYDPVNVAINRRDPVSAHVTRPELAPPSMAPAPGPFYPQCRIGPIHNVRPSLPEVIPAPSPSVGAPVKDINYYKSLIQQHGGERREPVPQFAHQSNLVSGPNQEAMNMMMKPHDSKPKIMKPCIYFNSPRGCRNGANCMYQHDVMTQQKANNIPEVQSSKRMKLDREITG